MLHSGLQHFVYLSVETMIYKHIARELVRFVVQDSGVASLTIGCADCDLAMYDALGFTIKLGNLLAFDA